ncbi:hypothetical protein Tco_1115640 [Tanacetum coccineum]
MNENKGIMPTKIELTLEQSQQGVSNDVLVSIEGVEEWKRNVWIKGLKKEALHTTSAETGDDGNLSRAIIKKALRYNIYTVKWSSWEGADDGVTTSFQQSQIHYRMLMLKL